MWIPKTEQDITNATSKASLEETSIFDAKKEIPSKNSEVAKDVSAMANSAGGVIVFGIKEDTSGRPTIPSPFDLKGQRERIDSIIRTSISEIPVFTITAIESQADSTKGYLVLVIPPSERAPHMVMVKNDRRFYGRGETGNYILGEAEIARLYERRTLALRDLLPILQKQSDNAPITEHRGFIHLHLLIKPVLQGDSILEMATENYSNSFGFEVKTQILLDNLFRTIKEANVFSPIKYHHLFSKPPSWIHQTNGFLGKIHSAYENDKTPNADTLHLTIGNNGSGKLFCGFIGRTKESEFYPKAKYFFADFAAYYTTNFLAYFGYLYNIASYLGKVDIGLGITGLDDCYADNVRESDIRFAYQHTEPNYASIERKPASVLKEEPQKVTSELLMPLIKTIYQDNYNPFDED